MDETFRLRELFHKILGHVTVVRSVLEMMKDHSDKISDETKEILVRSEERVKLLVEDLEELRRKVIGG